MSEANHIDNSRPDAELRRLDKLVGRWELTGEARGTVSYEWMDGGFFLLQRVDIEQAGHAIKGYNGSFNDDDTINRGASVWPGGGYQATMRKLS